MKQFKIVYYSTKTSRWINTAFINAASKAQARLILLGSTDICPIVLSAGGFI